jgi:hypothetical protein
VDFAPQKGENLLDVMNRATRIAMLLVGAAFVVPAYAQAPTQPNILLQMSRPQQPMAVESSMRDDIQNRPAPPRADPLQDPFRLYVGVGDPRCFPGEDGFMPERLPNGSRRRPR